MSTDYIQTLQHKGFTIQPPPQGNSGSNTWNIRYEGSDMNSDQAYSFLTQTLQNSEGFNYNGKINLDVKGQQRSFSWPMTAGVGGSH